jgi:hypothetical protein
MVASLIRLFIRFYPEKSIHHRAHRDHRGKTRSYDYKRIYQKAELFLVFQLFVFLCELCVCVNNSRL